MSDCCGNAACEISKLHDRQRATLRAVLGINLGMFAVEITAGLMAASTALLGDSLDMLGDALAYGFSLFVVGRHAGWKARAAYLKGGIMAVFGLFVLVQAGYKFMNPEIPHYETIGLVGLLALAANAACLTLLWRHRGEDVNMRSVWLCSRNDIIANLAVILAAAGVWLSASQWPDLIVGLGIAALFLHSSVEVFRDAGKTMAEHNAASSTVAEPARN